MNDKIIISLDNTMAPRDTTKNTCPVCATHIEENDSKTVCPACKVTFHEECWQDNKGCSTYGCKLVNVMNPPMKVDIPHGAPFGGMNRDQMLQQLRERFNRREIDQATYQRIYHEIMSAPMPAPSPHFAQSPSVSLQSQSQFVQTPQYTQSVSSPSVQPMPASAMSADTIKILNNYFMVFWICLIAMIPTCGIAAIPAVIYAYMLLYQLWKLIPVTIARTTPGRAVGFCFIPFFNFYWCFVAYKGLADDMNETLRRHGNAYSVNAGLALTTCILFIVQFLFSFSDELFVISCLLSLGMFITMVFFLKSAKDGGIALLTANQEGQAYQEHDGAYQKRLDNYREQLRRDGLL